jgi:hypothetical protein
MRNLRNMRNLLAVPTRRTLISAPAHSPEIVPAPAVMAKWMRMSAGCARHAQFVALLREGPDQRQGAPSLGALPKELIGLACAREGEDFSDLSCPNWGVSSKRLKTQARANEISRRVRQNGRRQSPWRPRCRTGKMRALIRELKAETERLCEVV